MRSGQRRCSCCVVHGVGTAVPVGAGEPGGPVGPEPPGGPLGPVVPPEPVGLVCAKIAGGSSHEAAPMVATITAPVTERAFRPGSKLRGDGGIAYV